MLKNIRISSVHFIPLSFLFMIIVGTVLLLLPGSIAPGGETGRKKFSLSERKLIGDSLNVEKNRGLLAFLTRIFKGVFLVEEIGTVLYAVKFIPIM